MLKKLMFFALAVLFVVEFGECTIVYTDSTRNCTHQRHCGKNECCSKRFMSSTSYCVQRRKEGELCIADEVGSSLINGVYDITCPCEGTLKCIRDEVTDARGVTKQLGNPRCRSFDWDEYEDPNYPVQPIQAPYGYPGASSFGNGAGSNAYAYGNGVPASNAYAYGNGGPGNNAYAYRNGGPGSNAYAYGNGAPGSNSYASSYSRRKRSAELSSL